MNEEIFSKGNISLGFLTEFPDRYYRRSGIGILKAFCAGANHRLECGALSRCPADRRPNFSGQLRDGGGVSPEYAAIFPLRLAGTDCDSVEDLHTCRTKTSGPVCTANKGPVRIQYI